MSTNVGAGGEVVDIDLFTTIKAFAITKAENTNLKREAELETNLTSRVSFELFCWISYSLIEISGKVEIPDKIPCFVKSP